MVKSHAIIFKSSTTPPVKAPLTDDGSENVVDAGQALLVSELVEELGEAERRAPAPVELALPHSHAARLEKAALAPRQFDPRHEVAALEVEVTLRAPQQRGHRGLGPRGRRWFAARSTASPALEMMLLMGRLSFGLLLGAAGLAQGSVHRGDPGEAAAGRTVRRWPVAFGRQSGFSGGD